MATAQLEDPKLKRWTLEEFYRLLDLGFFVDKRVELVEGEIVEMAAQKNFHAISIKLTEEALIAAFGPNHWVRVQMTLDLVGTSALDPDIAVIPGAVRANISPDNPTSALLIVEVSETTLNYDRKRKAEIYAKAGVEDYWVVDLVHRHIEVLRKPKRDSSSTSGFKYKSREVRSPSDMVSPLAVPKAKIRVGDLLP